MTAGGWPPPSPSADRHIRYIRAAIGTLVPGFVATDPPRRTETSLLIPGDLRGLPVIAKHPIDRRPFWLQRCRHEITVYRALHTAGQPPVPVPHLVAADPAALLLVLTRLPGQPLGPDRYPTQRLRTRQTTLLLDTLDALHHWARPPRSPPGPFPADDDYPAQLAAIRPNLTPVADQRRFTQLHTAIASRTGIRLEHGDAHPANTICTPDGLALIDLEATALRPPGFDLAMLWVLLGPDPATRRLITHRIGPDPPAQAAFWLAVALVLARETASHHRHAPTVRHRARLPRLRADQTTARHAITHLHADLT